MPLEMLCAISEHLNYPSTVALRLSCRFLYKSITQPERFGMTDLLEMELWPCYHPARERPDHLKQAFALIDYFACHICLKIKPALHFSNAMMKGRRGKFSDSALGARGGRFCISCGLATGRYHRGTQLDYGGMTGAGRLHGLVCKGCGKFKQCEYTSPWKICYDCLSRKNRLYKESRISEKSLNSALAWTGL